MDAAKSGSHWIVQMNYRNRSASFLALFAALAVHLYAAGHAWPLWILLVLQFLIYPHLVYWRAMRARETLVAELNNLLLDAFLFGMWGAWLGFPLWITFSMYIGVCINMMVFRGPRGVAQALISLALGIGAIWLLQGPRLQPETNWISTLLSIGSVSLYLILVGNIAFTRNIKVREAREQQRASHVALQAANMALQQQLEEISLLQAKLKQQADCDPLTGAYNRRYFDVSIHRELSQCRRQQQPLSFILVDIDHFKTVNDTFGHQAGDQILIALADILRLNSRGSDIVCRYGGEEFLIALPNTDLSTALQRAEHYRSAFAAGVVYWQEHRLQCTISLGLACYPQQAQDSQTLLRCADIALYKAKSDGRNRSIAYADGLANFSSMRVID